MRRISAACLALVLGATAAGAEGLPGTSVETREAARELATATGVENQVGQMLELMRGQMVQIIQTGAPTQSPAAIARIVDDVLFPEFRARIGELTDMMIEIFAANYSLEDLKALRAFYATPLGQRMLKAGPVIGLQGFVAGKQWGEKVANDAFRKNAEELRRRGVTL